MMWWPREYWLLPALLCVVAYGVGVLQATMWHIDYRTQVQLLRAEKVEAAEGYREQSLEFRQQVKDEQLRSTLLSQQLRLFKNNNNLDWARLWWNFHRRTAMALQRAATVLCHGQKAHPQHELKC